MCFLIVEAATDFQIKITKSKGGDCSNEYDHREAIESDKPASVHRRDGDSNGKSVFSEALPARAVLSEIKRLGSWWFSDPYSEITQGLWLP